MTIDQLLTDVSPLLPIKAENVTHWKAKQGTHHEEKYLAHAANHFSAMLQALREIAELGDCQKVYSHSRIAKQAIAAATEVTQ